VGAYRGSNANKVEELTGISDLQRLMQNKRIRWDAAVYGRYLPRLSEKAEQILRGVLEEDAELRWMTGGRLPPQNENVRVEELDEGAVEEWADSSRIGGRAAGATRGEGLYLGTMAT